MMNENNFSKSPAEGFIIGQNYIILLVLWEMDQAGEPKPLSFQDWINWKQKLLYNEMQRKVNQNDEIKSYQESS